MHARHLNPSQMPKPLLPALSAEFTDPAGVESLQLRPDAVLPEQFYSPSRGAAHAQGQVALMRAVLDDALTCYQKQLVPSTRRARRLAQEAEEWLFSDDDRWPFSFVNICRALALEPEYLRRGLKQWRQYPPAAPRQKPRRAIPSRRPLRIAA
jgi:hypothetical protein